MNFNLHIDRLVLDGIALTPRQQKELQTAVQSELVRLLISKGVGPRAAPRDNKRSIRGGSINIEKNNTAPGLGNQVAGAVYRGIMGNGSGTRHTQR